ncbi:threonine-phosphate decarboxylase CobD [Billgrantia montanilacus]|uniref:threonine-phosphate decarboxylase n=1 Tax=Billgrantia montanilacus TaxID=2282305 RepID=A0A368U2I6_9GAMM|nr:threonine-phosphate decarboxylase CobD [Halomonas montanilacus]RCV91214.1 threonine-phosphate decarboxylase [Halomonas montanilacus]
MRSHSAWPSHGGQASALLARFGLPAIQPLVDFSTNLNPLGPPDWLGDAIAGAMAGLSRYPDPSYTEPREAIARHDGVDPNQVLLTNGGAEAIFLAAGLHARGQAVIVEPSFSEYARACAAHGFQITPLPLAAPAFDLALDRLASPLHQADVLFLCRPNNPTGTLLPWHTMERLLDSARQQGVTVVVDEAFIDFVDEPGEALTPLLARFDNLILLRSLTKLYTLPGLRLGYLLAGAQTIRRLQAGQPPWSVNHLSAALVAPLMADSDFLDRTHAWLREERPRLQSGLLSLGLEVVPSRVNFFLVRQGSGSPAGDALLRRLLQAGILARHTHNFPGLDGGWVRLALRGRADNDRLLAALTAEGAP